MSSPSGDPPGPGGAGVSLPTVWQRITRTPLVLPTLLLVIVYLVATVTSVEPRLSLWGSYQRLQGTYTTLAYIVIFFLVLDTLHTREQLDRLITTALLTGLPISLYGIVQHFGEDPLPWIGDVISRVASTMGNSIFVAAFLIMLVPLTVGRLIEANSAAGSGETPGTRIVLGAGIAFYLLLQLAAWVISPTAGTLAATTTIITWLVVAVLLRKPVVPFLQVSAYSVLLSTQLICILFSQSRGTWLGLMAGLFFFGLLWALAQRMRRVALGLIALSVLVGGLLVALNLPNTPLHPICQKPYVGRMCQIFQTEGPTTGRVRVLIWEGAVNLITANPLRALIGYGPETMHVAYNPYYPPALGQVEARNASPDRSHNETFDALVITGLIGFVVYLLLFTSVFYYGLKWMGLIRNARQRNAFLGLWLAGGAAASLFFRLVEGSWKFFGVGLPAGMILGLFAYLALFAILVRSEPAEGLPPLRLILVALLSAIVAHFVEIHFGIAIAATRTYFWVYAALLVLAGYLYRWRPRLVESSEMGWQAHLNGAAAHTTSPPDGGSTSSRSRRRRSRGAEMGPATVAARGGSAAKPQQTGERRLIALSLLVGLILITMIYDFLSPQIDLGKNLILVWLIGFTWLFAGLLLVGETRPPGSEGKLTSWLAGFGIYVVVSGAGPLLFTPVHRAFLASAADLGNVIIPYYVFVLLTMATLAGVLLWREWLPERAAGGLRVIAYPVMAVVFLGVIFLTNLKVVQADIYYKQAWVGYHQRGDYDTALALYDKALELQPEQDFYLLFEGKALLEKGQRLEDPAQRDALLLRALAPLERARQLNPLNTDHVANLARLYQTWGELSTDPDQRYERLSRSLVYYADATKLSPSNAQLWNEWGRTELLIGNTEEALAKFQHSLELDDTYDVTYFQLGELYRTESKWPEAAAAYEKAIERNPGAAGVHNVLAYAYVQLGRTEDAVREYLKVQELAPNEPSAHRNLALLYRELERWNEALQEARAALALAPEDQGTQALVKELEQKQ